MPIKLLKSIASKSIRHFGVCLVVSLALNLVTVSPQVSKQKSFRHRHDWSWIFLWRPAGRARCNGGWRRLLLSNHTPGFMLARGVGKGLSLSLFLLDPCLVSICFNGLMAVRDLGVGFRICRASSSVCPSVAASPGCFWLSLVPEFLQLRTAKNC